MLLLAGIASLASSDAPDGSAVPVAAAAATAVAPSVPGNPGNPRATSVPVVSPAAPPSPSGDPVLVGAGDIADCATTDDEATASLVEGIPGIVFTLGDNTYTEGTEAEFRDCFEPSWGRFKDRIALPVPGNHDHATEDAAGYRAYFGAAATPSGTTWYSRDIGAWHVIVLDSSCATLDGGCGPDSPQGRWLRDDLAASDARCTLALWHHPRFSSGYHGSDETVAPFWEALYAAGADLVLNGHEHDYERFAPQDPAGVADPARGLTQIVAGTGGIALREFGEPIPNAVVRSNVAHGVVVLTLGQTGWTYRFQAPDGMFADGGSGTCH